MRTLKPLTLTEEEARIVWLRVGTRIEQIEPDDTGQTLDGPCYVYQGAWENERGHKKIKWQGRMVYVHRLTYTAEYGEIPDGLILDHKCRCPACCNPKHCEPVSVKVNTERGNGKWIFEQGYTARDASQTSNTLEDV